MVEQKCHSLVDLGRAGEVYRTCRGGIDAYGLIGKITSKPGQRHSLLALLLQGAENMPGCLTYIVARALRNQDAIWVTEVWTDEESHKASLQLPSVQNAITQAMPLIETFEPGIITRPVGGVGLPETTQME